MLGATMLGQRFGRPIFMATTVLIFAFSGRSSAESGSPLPASAEYRLTDRQALSSIELIATDANASGGLNAPVTDVVLFVARSRASHSKPASDSPEEPRHASPAALGPATLFAVRILVVAGGRLYTGARGRCGAWNNGVAQCALDCDGGNFAMRRNGGAPLELLLGAIPGGEAGEGHGLTVSPCGFDDDAMLKVKAGRGLAVIGFSSD